MDEVTLSIGTPEPSLTNNQTRPQTESGPLDESDPGHLSSHSVNLDVHNSRKDWEFELLNAVIEAAQRVEREEELIAEANRLIGKNYPNVRIILDEHPDRPVRVQGEIIDIRLNEKKIGVFHITGEPAKVMPEQDRRLWKTVARQLALAIDRIRTQTTLRISQDFLARTRVLDRLEDLLPVALDQILSATHIPAGAFFLYDPVHQKLANIQQRGWLTAIGDLRILQNSNPVVESFCKQQANYIRDTYTADWQLNGSGVHPPSGWSGFGLPLSNGQETFGVLFVAFPGSCRLAEDKQKLLEALGHLASVAICRIRLLEQTEENLARITSLRAIDRAIIGSTDLPFTLSIVLEQVLARLNADAATILTFDHNSLRLELISQRGFISPANATTSMLLGEGLAGRAAWTGERMVVTDLGVLEPGTQKPGAIAAEGFISYAAVPLRAKGRINGVLEVFFRRLYEPDTEWVDFLETLAGQTAIAINNGGMFSQLQRSNSSLQKAYDDTLEGWARALELRDQETEGHARRVTNLTVRLAEAMGLAPAEIEHIRRGALLHDIGKMGIPDSILHKPGPLDESEWEIMRRHPVWAFEILAPIAFLRQALDIPYHHHERWDGSGYPHGLRGDRIPLAARLFAVVDVWDALLSDRPYRPAWSVNAARSFLQEQAGTLFDPHIVHTFLSLVT